MDECNHFSELCPWCQIESLQAEIVELKAGKPQDWRQSAEYLSLKEAIERVKALPDKWRGVTDWKSKHPLNVYIDCADELEQAIGEQGDG
jgi:hypothetical protein